MAQPPSQYRINKWRAYAYFIDLNKDGYITKDDCEMVAVNMARLQNACEERAERIRAEFTQWWEVVSGGKQIQRITTEDFVQNIVSYFSTTDLRIIKEANAKTYSQLFDTIDANGDGFITREELKIYYHSYSFTDDDFINRVFDLIDTNGNGVISRDELVNAEVAFWTSDDPENGCEYLHDPAILKSGGK